MHPSDYPIPAPKVASHEMERHGRYRRPITERDIVKFRNDWELLSGIGIISSCPCLETKGYIVQKIVGVGTFVGAKEFCLY